MKLRTALVVACALGAAAACRESQAPDVVAVVVVAPASPTLTVVGANVQLTAEARDAQGKFLSGRVFTWTSADTSKVRVSASGIATAVGWGTTRITATTGGISGAATVTASPPAQAGSSHILLSDGPFPFDRLARVDIYVVSVSGSLTPDTGAGSGGWVTLASPHSRIDMLNLQNGTTAELGSLTLPRGAITAVQMVIDTDSSSITLKDGRVLNGENNGIHWQSSAGRPVLNALIAEQIAVPDTGAVIVIDWDLGQTFTTPQVLDSVSTDSSFTFMAQLSAADARRTGSITGVVRAHTADGAPVRDASLRLYIGFYPGGSEGYWGTMGTAKTDSAGNFRFSFVTRSSYWASTAWAGATYIVVADPPSGTTLGRTFVPNVSVTVGTVTSLGTVVLP